MPLIQETPACALMDAENGFGQIAGVKAVGDIIHGQKSADGTSIYLPGEIETMNETQYRKQGIGLTKDLVETLNIYATRYGAKKLQ